MQFIMGRSILWVFLSLVLCLQSSSSVGETMTKGSSISMEKLDDIMLSPNGLFFAGFYAVGENAYCFSIWFIEPIGQNATIVWMANRDQPINGKRSTLTLLDTGNLVLMDAGQSNIWDTKTSSISSLNLLLYDTRNLVLHDINVSSRGESNHSSGFYQLFFDNDNVLRLLYDGPDVSSAYWLDPWLLSWDAQRTTYNSTRVAVLDALGQFNTSDNFNFTTSDYRAKIQRRLTLDHDGNLRVYSWRNGGDKWYVSWQVKSRPCKIHGVCGANSLCTFNHISGGKCSCPPGYEMNLDGDWSYECKPKFDFACQKTKSCFLRISNVELYGYDYASYGNYTYKQCESLCFQLCDCKGFQYSYNKDTGLFTCYPKLKLLNGYCVSYFAADLYVRLHASSLFTYEESFKEYENLACPKNLGIVEIERAYQKDHESGTLKFMLWFACGIGGLEIVCIFLVWCFLIRTRKESGVDNEGYGIVILEMITGKSATVDVQVIDVVDMQQQRLVTWVRDKQNKGSPTWVEEIVDPAIEGDYDLNEIEVLARVALQCVEEEKGKRSTMSQVVEMLQSISLRKED
ncbi:hypothetical protein L6164_036902 [Bauhinia variegata]|uniref:Uncharacterized protein n=1 Tax=Bauhinia variegata TaxID=167791 RepID=A0ACB9KIM0_BAUVA|nr:hypothetical protein L6164_036902 [Bauhinia variegata]